MRLFFLILFTGFILNATAIFAQNGVSANATRPSASDNAYLTAKGYTELEIGGAFMENSWSIPALLKFAATDKVELGFAMSGILNHYNADDDSETEAGDPGVQLKAQLHNAPGGAIAVAGRVDFISDVDPTYTIYGVGSYLAPTFQLDVTLGGSFFDAGDDTETAFNYAAAVSPKMRGNLGVFLEIFGQSAPDYSPMAVDFGISLAQTPRLIFDAALALGLSDDAPDWQVQVGFTSMLFPLSR